MNTIYPSSTAKQRRIARLATNTAAKHTISVSVSRIPANFNEDSVHPNRHIPLLPGLPATKKKGQNKQLQQNKKRKTKHVPPRPRSEYTPLRII